MAQVANFLHSLASESVKLLLVYILWNTVSKTTGKEIRTGNMFNSLVIQKIHLEKGIKERRTPKLHTASKTCDTFWLKK